MQWEQEFVALCLQLQRKDDYGDKQKRRKHNAAMDKLKKLEEKMENPSQGLSRLLDHEDSRVRNQAAAACMALGLLHEKTVRTLRDVIVNEQDTTLKFSASMLLKQCMEE